MLLHYFVLSNEVEVADINVDGRCSLTAMQHRCRERKIEGSLAIDVALLSEIGWKSCVQDSCIVSIVIRINCNCIEKCKGTF